MSVQNNPIKIKKADQSHRQKLKKKTKMKKTKKQAQSLHKCPFLRIPISQTLCLVMERTKLDDDDDDDET